MGNFIVLAGMAGMKGLILLLSMMMMMDAWRHSQNTIFKKTSEVIITRSKWLVTFVIDLNPYGVLLGKMEDELAKLGMARNRVTQKYARDEKYLRLLDAIELETAVLGAQWKGMKDYLKGVELLQTRKKRAVLPIIGKALGVLFGTVTDDDIESIRKRLGGVEKDQKVLAQAAKESVSILNVTRLELTENRVSINRLINDLRELRQEIYNQSRTVVNEFQALSGFVQQYFQLISIVNKVRQSSQTLTILMEHVRAQLDMLSLGHLSPGIVTPGHLRELLLKIQAELPHHLRLPVSPDEDLWKYYNALGCVTLLENKKLLVLMSIPLLDRESIFEVYQVVNLPIPYPQATQGLEAVATYRIETEYIAMNSARTKFMLLTAGEARECQVDALGTCTSSSPIYVTGNHKLCVLELFRGDNKRIRESCQVEILTDAVLPQAISISDGVWAVATQRPIDLSKVCGDEPTRTLKVSPPLSLVELPLGCSAFGVSISLPPYYQAEEKYEERDSLIETVRKSLSNWTDLWEPVTGNLTETTLRKMTKLLEPIDRISLDQLKAKLNTIGESTVGERGKQTILHWSVSLGTLMTIAVIVMIVWKLKRYRDKSVDGVLASSRRLEEGESYSVLSNRSNQDGKETQLDSAEKMNPEPASIDERQNPPIGEKRKVTKQARP